MSQAVDDYRSLQLCLKLRVLKSEPLNKDSLFKYLKYRLNLSKGTHNLIVLDEVFLIDGLLKG